MPFYERQPYITPLYQVLLEILRGEILVPRFQRPGTDIVWSPEQRGDLLDSLYRGFPVGTILLWSTTSEIKCMEKVAGFAVPNATESGRPRRLLLDGHQRLSTLLAVLGPGLRSEVPGAFIGYQDILRESWVFETRLSAKRSNQAGPEPTDIDDTRERFIPLRDGQQPKSTQVPLNILLDRVQMNRWMRGEYHGASGGQRVPNPRPHLSDEEIRTAEAVRDKLREYSIPVAVLVADSLDEATESFKRVNSSGTPMGTFHMVKALAYGSDFDLEETFEKLRAQYLEVSLWKDLDDTDLLRICAGLVVNGDPMKFSVDKLAKNLRQQHGVLENAFRSCFRAATAFGELGVHGPKTLPYTWQLIIVAVVLGSHPEFTLSEEVQREGLRQWFWTTTYGEVFAGVTASYQRAKRSLEGMLLGTPWRETEMVRDVTEYVEQEWRFDYRTVRSRAFALLLARTYDRSKLDGLAHQTLAQIGRDALGTIRRGGPRSEWSELVLVPHAEELQEVRNQLKGGQLSLNGELSCLERHGFVDADMRLGQESALAIRKQRLADVEKAFVEELDLRWRNSPDERA